MKKTLKKILVVLLIILTINNFLVDAVYADDDDSLGSTVSDILQGMLESVVGLFTYPVRFIALAAATAINSLTASIAYIEGSTDPNSDLGADNSVDIPLVPFDADKKVFKKSITPFDIFFNKVKILDVNFLDIETEEPAASSIVNKIRIGIATWYYVLRMIAFAILLVILIYVGIRMSITTIASDKAMYKKMLLDWITSLVLVFLIPYIISFTLIVSNSIVNSISLGVDSEKITNTYTVIAELAFKILDIDSIAATIVYCMLVWQTLGLVFSYFNRMLKVAFLVIISPLITLTYSIDKMGDGKAQALGNWTKEYVYTILIQPFHCIIYMCFIDIAFNLLLKDPAADKNTMAIAVISILCVRFVKEAEKIVRKIFDFKDDGSTSLGTGLAMATMAISQSKNIGRSAKSMVNSAKNIGSATVSGIRSMGRVSATGIGKIAAGGVLIGQAAKNKFGITEEQKIEKEMDKNGEGYARKENESDAQYEARRAEAKQNITDKAQKKSEKKLERFKKKEIRKQKRANGVVSKTVKGVKGTVGRVKSVYRQSEVLQGISSMTKGYTAAGLALMGASGVYGNGGNLSTAIATGFATYNSSKEFMKNTTQTLANGVDGNLRGLRVKSKKGAQMKFNGIMSKFSNSEEVDKELKGIMKEIGDALTKVGIDEKYQSKIKNTIQSGIKANPSKTQDIIKYALTNPSMTGGQIAKDGKSLYETNGGSVRAAVQKLADFTNESQIYESVQNAGNVGVSADAFVGKVVGNYEVSNAERNERFVEESDYQYKDIEDYTERIEEIDLDISSMNISDLGQLAKAFDDKKAEIEKSYYEIDKDSRLDKLDRDKTDFISKALSQMQYDKDGIVDRMKTQYEQQLRNEIDKVQKELNRIQEKSPYRDVLEMRKTRMIQTADILKEQTMKDE